MKMYTNYNKKTMIANFEGFVQKTISFLIDYEEKNKDNYGGSLTILEEFKILHNVIKRLNAMIENSYLILESYNKQ